MIHAPTLERRLEVERVQQRIRDRGIVTGHSDEGDPVDQAFVAEIGRRHGPETAAAVGEAMNRNNLIERGEQEMYADPGVRQQLERLDDERRFDEEARELARRVRCAERLRERALEIRDPRAEGGPDTPENPVPLCVRCHGQEFAAERRSGRCEQKRETSGETE